MRPGRFTRTVRQDAGDDVSQAYEAALGLILRALDRWELKSLLDEGSTQSLHPVEAPSLPELCLSSEAAIKLVRRDDREGVNKEEEESRDWSGEALCADRAMRTCTGL